MKLIYLNYTINPNFLRTRKHKKNRPRIGPIVSKANSYDGIPIIIYTHPLYLYSIENAELLHPKSVKNNKTLTKYLIFKLIICSSQKNIIYLSPDNLNFT